MVKQTCPRPFAVGLMLVWIGVWVGTLDVVANTVGLFTMTWVWRDHIEDYPVALLVIGVVAVVGVAAAIGTVSLLRRARGQSRSGRIGLAALMFCFVPGAAANFAVTELAYLIWTVTDWASQHGNQIPDWTPPLLVGSLVADGVLLSLALTAGILLLLPVSARHTSRS
ncbi:hypothetical protein [Micromonospora sp. CPCC 206061]|uniref:hypothetical protein n=1 Tax=Micromonospora sp. CPCC 206061 TaxID=3122410 RepID=UPI002FEF4CA1